jgi:biphenyl-2,3-diol 1,2-dioxygenase
VRDLEVMLDFYKRGLGVKISDFINMTVGSMKFQVCFTHVNPRHHSLALAQASGAPNSPRAPKQKKMNHFLLEANELDDVGVALDIFKQRGMPVGQLGKHTNDHMVSFYAPTPSGFTVEYGCNGRSIKDEESWEVRNYEAASVWGHEMPAASAPPSGAAAEPSAG